MRKKLTFTKSSVVQAVSQSFAIARRISPNMIPFDIFKNIWNSLSVTVNSLIGSLGILMITKVSNHEDVNFWITIFIISVSLWLVISQLIAQMEVYFDNLASEKIFQEQKVFTQEKIDSLDPAQLFSNELSRIQTEFITKGWKSMISIYNRFFTIIQKFISFVISLALIVWLSPSIILLVIIPGIFSAVSLVLTNRKVLKVWEEGHHDRVMFDEYNELASKNNKSVLQTIFHDSRSYFKNRFLTKREEVAANSIEIQKIQISRKLLFVIVDIVFTVLAFIVMSRFIIGGTITVAKWPIIFGAFFGLKNSIGILGVNLANIVNSFQEYQKYFVPFATLKPVYKTGDCHPKTIMPITFDHATFTYPNKHRPAIDDISFSINQGEIIGLIGANGSGKTTLIKMIANVYFPEKGSVLIGGISSDSISRKALFKHLLVESAYDGLPNTTIREIVSASLDSVHDEKTWEALRIVDLEGFVSDLPNKLDTFIGEKWKDGIQLSTGQKKRMSLAALFFKSTGSSVEMVILDEPMGNIDPETKKDLYSRVTSGSLFPGKTVLVSLHDEYYIPLFKRTITLSEGAVVPKTRIKTEAISSFSLYETSE